MTLQLTKEQCQEYGTRQDELEGIWQLLDEFKRDQSQVSDNLMLREIEEYEQERFDGLHSLLQDKIEDDIERSLHEQEQ